MNTYGLLKISGPDAKKLLQGQVTADVEKLKPNEPQLSALCNPQGRIISLFYIILSESDYFLYMLEPMIFVTQKALKKYAVFYKVELMPTGTEGISKVIFPNIYPETSCMFLPHDLELDKLNAISFDKGCYTGQEIIARMHYRGKLKKRLFHIDLESHTPPQPGSEIAGGTLVDAREKAYNIYEVLILTDEANAEHVKKITYRSSAD